MATYPFKVHCNGTTKNAFKATFSEELSAAPQIRIYDNSATYPSTDSSTSTSFRIFKGSTVNSNLPMVHFVDTSGGPPSTVGWHTQSTYAAGVATCIMAGDASYLTFRVSGAQLNAGGSVHWNAVVKTPSDVYPTLSKLHNVVLRYQYTGDSPTVTFYANNEHEGGTGLSPVWGTITADSHGVKFGSATATNTSILANIPLTGQEVTTTAWVTTS